MKFVKKPVEIEAFQWTNSVDYQYPEWFQKYIDDGKVTFSATLDGVPYFQVETNSGWAKGYVGDWLVHGLGGEVYPVKDTVFAQSYDLAA